MFCNSLYPRPYIKDESVRKVLEEEENGIFCVCTALPLSNNRKQSLTLCIRKQFILVYGIGYNPSN